MNGISDASKYFVETEYPPFVCLAELRRNGGKKMTVETLKSLSLLDMSQEELDELYKKGSVREIPAGDGRGIAIIAAGSLLAKILAFVTKLLIWQGKVLYPDQKFFFNRTTPFRIQAIKGKIYKGESRFCGGESIILDYANTSFVLRKVREEAREIAPGLYLALVYWGGKRLSYFTLEF